MLSKTDALDALIHLRVPADMKARWVRESRSEGLRLTEWIVRRIERRKENEMPQIITDAGAAISRSAERDEIVTIHADSAEGAESVYLDLLALSDECDRADNNGVIEAWGTDDDGRAWRVHVTR